MVDFVSAEKRSKIMRGVIQKNTKPEIAVRRALHALGFRFRLHRKDLPGKPDIVLPRFKTLIMVHGCFWHQHVDCKEGRIPTSNVEYWKPKLARNIQRDTEKEKALVALGWRVHTIWECEARDPVLLEGRIRSILPKKKPV